MAQINKLIAKIKNNPTDVRFDDLAKVCDYYFGEPRQQGTSHRVYKTPWQGDPRVTTRAFAIRIKNPQGRSSIYKTKKEKPNHIRLNKY